MKNRIGYLIMALIVCTGLVFGCGKVVEDSQVIWDEKVKTTNQLEIVCTTFAQYDWMRELLDGCDSQFELTLLIDNGVDLHSYQPSVADIAKISNADMVIYNGGESEQWVTELVQGENNKDIKEVVHNSAFISLIVGLLMLLIGLFLNSYYLALLGVALYGLAVAFQLITLPVELNASKRAMQALTSTGLLMQDEAPKARKVLNAAASTYLAAAFAAVAQLLRLLSIVGSGRRRD